MAISSTALYKIVPSNTALVGLSFLMRPNTLVPMMTAEGYRVMGKVLEIGDKVKMDFNHPFAGKTVRYQGQIVEVREATEEEIHPTSGCGGCCGGGCGDSDGDGCGGGCDSKGGCCGGC